MEVEAHSLSLGMGSHSSEGNPFEKNSLEKNSRFSLLECRDTNTLNILYPKDFNVSFIPKETLPQA